MVTGEPFFLNKTDSQELMSCNFFQYTFYDISIKKVFVGFFQMTFCSFTVVSNLTPFLAAKQLENHYMFLLNQ